MKRIILLILGITLFSCQKDKAYNYTQEIKKYQYERNVFFSDVNTSPLKEEDLKNFRSLKFFPIDSKYQVTATLSKPKEPQIITVNTTTSDKRKYLPYAIAQFKINEIPFELTIYESVSEGFDPLYRPHLFLPFTDLTNGKTSYESGRYLDIKKVRGDELILDFNKAYSPYCAYDEDYSCPIPPKENQLDIAIKAGEMIYSK